MSTPQEPVPSVDFDVVRRGFDPDQVRAQFEKLEYDLRIATADQALAAARVSELREQLGHAQTESEELRAQLDEIASQPLTEANLPVAMKVIVEQARREAATIRAAADVEATQSRQHAAATASAELAAARSETTKLNANSNQLREALDEERAAFHDEQQRLRTELAAEIAERLAAAEAQSADIVAQANSEAESLVAAAQQETQELAAHALTQRTTETEDFELTIHARRMEAHAAIATEEKQAAAAAQSLVADAQEQAQHTIQAAQIHAHTVIDESHRVALQHMTKADTMIGDVFNLRSEIMDQLAALDRQLAETSAIIRSAPQTIAPPTSEADRPTADQISTPTSWQPPPLPAKLAEYLADDADKN